MRGKNGMRFNKESVTGAREQSGLGRTGGRLLYCCERGRDLRVSPPPLLPASHSPQKERTGGVISTQLGE
jgi:hypothetical protein